MASRASVTVSMAADTSGRFSLMLRERWVAREVSRGRTWENAGTNRTSSKVSALPSRRMGKAPDAKADYRDRTGLCREGTNTLRLVARHARCKRRAEKSPPLHSAAMLNTRISRLCVFVAVIAATAALPAAAQWKWKDSRGQTQYSDTPPPASVPERDILLRPNAAALRPVAVSTTSAPAPAASAAPADNELDAKKRQADQQEAARKRAEEEKIAQARADN